ncbi:MAG: sigma-70 family RNA polymerase sigma factor [Anaerolineae bacterium]|nr:sigma-70 family RNA polymerase sigma factor [Anaerolineae bacterium]
MTHSPSERQLVEAAQRSKAAFRQLYQQYSPQVYAYVAYRVGSRWDTEDVVSEIWLKVIEAFPRFQHQWEGSFRAWLFRIAYHSVTDHFRQQRSTPALALDDLPELHSHDLSPDDALARREEFMRLRGLIQTLTPRRQEILTLKFYGGLRNIEIASILNLDERTIAAHLCRAIEDLQRQYHEEVQQS